MPWGWGDGLLLDDGDGVGCSEESRARPEIAPEPGLGGSERRCAFAALASLAEDRIADGLAGPVEVEEAVAACDDEDLRRGGVELRAVGMAMVAGALRRPFFASFAMGAGGLP